MFVEALRVFRWKSGAQFACLQAKERGTKRIIALSTQSYGFFSNVCGFEESTKEILPEARLKLYDDSGRNARFRRQQASSTSLESSGCGSRPVPCRKPPPARRQRCRKTRW